MMQPAARRRALRVPLVCLWLLAGLALAGLVTLTGRVSSRTANRVRPLLSRGWMRGMIRLLPLRVRYQGQPAQGAALWTSNHVSWLDILVLGAHTPVRFLSKAEVARWPVIGWLATAAGTLYLRRGEGQAGALDAQIGEALAAGQSVALFAEGTTTDGSRVRTFHGRLLGSALRTGVPVQPVALTYRRAGELDEIAPFIGDDEFSRHLWRLLGAPRIDVSIYFPDALPASDCNRNQLARSAQLAVTEALGLESCTQVSVARAA